MRRNAIDGDRREENVTGDPVVDDRDERQRTGRSAERVDDVGFDRSAERAFVDDPDLTRVAVLFPADGRRHRISTRALAENSVTGAGERTISAWMRCGSIICTSICPTGVPGTGSPVRDRVSVYRTRPVAGDTSRGSGSVAAMAYTVGALIAPPLAMRTCDGSYVSYTNDSAEAPCSVNQLPLKRPATSKSILPSRSAPIRCTFAYSWLRSGSSQ